MSYFLVTLSEPDIKVELDEVEIVGSVENNPVLTEEVYQELEIRDDDEIPFELPKNLPNSKGTPKSLTQKDWKVISNCPEFIVDDIVNAIGLTAPGPNMALPFLELQSGRLPSNSIQYTLKH